MGGLKEEHVGLCNHRARASLFTSTHSLVVIPAALLASPFTLARMSDRKRALEDGGPSLASKKARRSVFILLTPMSSC